MKKILLFIFFLGIVLSGCANQPEISSADIAKNIPENYEQFDIYYENLDKDREDEIILLLQQSRSYLPNVEVKTLPVIIKILDTKNGILVASQERKIEDFSNHFSTGADDNKQAPYKIVNKDDEKWIILKTKQHSFDGISYGVDIFSYSDDSGLFPILFNYDRKRQYALTSLIDKTDKLYLMSCNPWLIWGNVVTEDELKIVTEVIDLNGERPRIYSMDLDIKCKALEDEFGQMDRIEPDDLEKFLNKSGVYL